MSQKFNNNDINEKIKALLSRSDSAKLREELKGVDIGKIENMVRNYNLTDKDREKIMSMLNNLNTDELIKNIKKANSKYFGG